MTLLQKLTCILLISAPCAVGAQAPDVKVHLDIDVSPPRFEQETGPRPYPSIPATRDLLLREHQNVRIDVIGDVANHPVTISVDDDLGITSTTKFATNTDAVEFTIVANHHYSIRAVDGNNNVIASFRLSAGVTPLESSVKDLGAKLRRGAIFKHTFKDSKDTVQVCVDKVCLAHDLRIAHPFGKDQRSRPYIMVPYSTVYKGNNGITPEEFVKPENWGLAIVKPSGEKAQLPQDIRNKDGGYAVSFGVTDVLSDENQLYAILELNGEALGSDDTNFALSFKALDREYCQTVPAKGANPTPLIDPLSLQHKTDQEVLRSTDVKEVDQLKASVYRYLGDDLSISGTQLLSTNHLDTAAKLELDLHKILPGQDYYHGSSYTPVSLVVGATTNQAFSHQVIRAGMEVRAYQRHLLRGLIDSKEYRKLFIPPYPIEQVDSIPWWGLSLFGSYVAKRDPDVTSSNHRFYSYLKPQISLIVSQIASSDQLIRSGLGFDGMLKAWVFLSGRQNAGDNLHAMEEYAHAFVTVKLGTQQGYFGYEWGTNEANGFRKAHGWTIGVDLKF